MEVLRERVDPEPFLRGLSDAPERALLLDYDGTLAPFRAERDRAAPYPGVHEVLERLLETGHSRVVIEAARDAVPEAGSA